MAATTDFVAAQKGFYAAEGIELEIIEASGSASVAPTPRRKVRRGIVFLNTIAVARFFPSFEVIMTGRPSSSETVRS